MATVELDQVQEDGLSSSSSWWSQTIQLSTAISSDSRYLQYRCILSPLFPAGKFVWRRLSGLQRKIQNGFTASYLEGSAIIGLGSINISVKGTQPNPPPAPGRVPDLRRELTPRSTSNSPVVPPLLMMITTIRHLLAGPFLCGFGWFGLFDFLRQVFWSARSMGFSSWTKNESSTGCSFEITGLQFWIMEEARVRSGRVGFRFG